jgi:hypothetical protein
MARDSYLKIEGGSGKELRKEDVFALLRMVLSTLLRCLETKRQREIF